MSASLKRLFDRTTREQVYSQIRKTQCPFQNSMIVDSILVAYARKVNVNDDPEEQYSNLDAVSVLYSNVCCLVRLTGIRTSHANTAKPFSFPDILVAIAAR